MTLATKHDIEIYSIETLMCNFKGIQINVFVVEMIMSTDTISQESTTVYRLPRTSAQLGSWY